MTPWAEDMHELWVRVKISTARSNCKQDAEKMENELLAKYNYAWNIRLNNAIRKILPDLNTPDKH